MPEKLNVFRKLKAPPLSKLGLLKFVDADAIANEKSDLSSLS